MPAESRWRIWHRWIRRLWVTGGLFFIIWLAWNAQAHGVPGEVFESDSIVRVSQSDHGVTFDPVQTGDGVPVVFLPGGGVDPAAYAPLVRQLAVAGHPTALVFLPWRAAFTQGARESVRTRIVNVSSRWPGRPFVLAGHSRGAALAAQFAATGLDRLAGLILVATTHPRDHDLSGSTLPVLKILGSRDCVAPPDQARAHASRLPGSTTWVVLDGANHAQFGSYGTQLGDCRATLPRPAQQWRLQEAILAWLGQR